jgi:hypothetical protein
MSRHRRFTLRAGISDHPILAQELGNLNVAWSALEYRVFGLFEILCGLPIPLARSIYFSQRTTRGRIELVLAIAPVILRKRRGKTGLGGTTKDVKRVSTMLGNIISMSGARNKYVHDPWTSTAWGRKPYQLRLGGKEIHSDYESVSLTELKRLISKIETKVEALSRLYDYLAPKLVPLHQRLELQHELTLVFAKKAIHPKKKKAKHQRPRRPSGT